MLKGVINALLTIVSICYPLAMLGEWGEMWLNAIPFILAGLWFIKALQAVKFYRYFAMLMTVLLALSLLSRMAFNLMYWYPVLINGVMLGIFGGSLWQKQSLVERLARLQDPHLPPQAVKYTRQVTKVWCGVFMFNIVVSASLVWWNQIDLWALYTGVIAYVIMGVVMAGEWLIRPKHQ